MARAVNAQRVAAHHRNSRHDYELIVSYLEVLENFVATSVAVGRRKSEGKLDKDDSGDHMVVSMCVQGFSPCNGVVVGKKYNRPAQTKTVTVLCRSRDERKNSLISTYEDQAKEKLVLRKTAQEHKVTFRDAIVDDRRYDREAKQISRMTEALEMKRRARVDRRSILMTELVKNGKTMDDVTAVFRLLDNVEQMINANI
ncbi:hypothetical protein R1sor_022881 [Riccia sorocarpa]|uniref:Uncharacterized protein n=1 Tax=Riccia sorocarpa TaxID=122646 RepID=A0ABD3GPA9_9MARC